MKKLLLLFNAIALSCGCCFAQESGDNGGGGKEGTAFVPVMAAPDFDARLSVGFNYDFLKDPTRVSFDYPKGYLGLNVPLKYGLDKNITDRITEKLADNWEEGDEFEPTASAKQNANTTIRVEMPMIRGVGQFSNIQNFHLNYSNTLGEPRVLIHPAIDSIDLMMQGMISVPLDVAMGWETMTLGYAYKVNDLLSCAVNLHRHIFQFDLAAKIDIDLLGYLELKLPEIAPKTGQEVVDELTHQVAQDLLQGIGRQWINYIVQGEARGHYEVEVWSPTFAVRLWRAGLTYRYGIDTRAGGYLSAKYVVPFFVNPETFAMDSLSDPNYLMGNINRFLNGETDSIEYVTSNDLVWKMPHALTFTFDIVRDKLYLSYTKFFGEVNMFLGDIAAVTIPQGPNTDSAEATAESIDFDVGVKVDHIIMLHGTFQNAFMNLGVFTMDFRYGDRDNLLERIPKLPKLGGGLLLPTLNFGTTFGSKLKLLLELDVLPLSALKTGVIYYF